MNGIRAAIATELEEVSARQVELAAELDKVEARIQQLEDLDEQAKQLDGGEAPVAAPPSAAGAASPRRKTSTSAGRRSAPAKAASHASSGEAHTASGASTGGRPSAVKADDIVDHVRGALRRLGPASPNAIGLHLGYPKSTSGMVAVREVIAKLLAAGEVKVDGQVRGRPAYALVSRGDERAIPLPPGRPSEGSRLVDGLVDKILELLEADGGRVARVDLKARVGNPDSEDFNVAVDRALNLKKINRVSAGGIAGYELVK